MANKCGIAAKEVHVASQVQDKMNKSFTKFDVNQ